MNTAPAAIDQSLMRHYIGTKTLRACPMTRGEYNRYRGWAIPENENPHEAGYLVEYDPTTPNSNANDSRHTGYISWSPADVFEATYAEIPSEAEMAADGPDDSPVPSTLQPHQYRVIDEKLELDAKLSALCAFIGGSTFKAVPDDERARLLDQARAMLTYSTILGARIDAFVPTPL